jgi:hypothetical protein
MNYYMSSAQPIYKQPSMYEYTMTHPPMGHYPRKNSEGSALLGGHLMMQKHNSAFKANSFNKKQSGRKRILSSSEAYIAFDNQKFRQFSGNLSNTKDSSTSSNAKYSSPNNKQNNAGASQEPKSLYLIQLRQCIKDKGEENIRIGDLKDHIAEISQDQIGSRFIQKVYEESTEDEK